MAYLDNSTITVDAILTKKGRELFAKSSSDFKITKFAVSDDEIDYRLYDKTHPSGSAYYADAIENLPILEALPDETKMLKYKLISLPKNTTTGYVVTVAQNTYSSFWMPETYTSATGKNVQPASEAEIIPQTSANADDAVGYTAVLYNSTYLDISVPSGYGVSSAVQKSVTALQNEDGGNAITKVGKRFMIKAKQLPSGVNTSGPITIRITGNASGQSVTVTVTVKRRSAETDATS